MLINKAKPDLPPVSLAQLAAQRSTVIPISITRAVAPPLEEAPPPPPPQPE